MLNMFVEDFTVLDHAFVCQELGFQGGTFFVDAEVIGVTTEEEAVVIDFSQAKKILKKVIDETIDHKLVVPRHMLEEMADGRWRVRFKQGEYIAPKCAFYVLESRYYSVENVRAQLEKEIMNAMPENVEAVRLTLRYEDFTDYSFYRYTHGLKTSSSVGCRRMGHGHINKIIIEKNGKRDRESEALVANFFNGKHLCYKKNIFQEGDYTKLFITVDEGEFDLKFKASECIIMKEETTVENICQYIANELLPSFPNESKAKWVVKAFEGYKKGCICVRE